MNSCDFKNFKAIHSKTFLSEIIDEGEHTHQDFKYAITDSRKISRSIAAFANNDGGRLLIGVKDNGAIAGMKSDEEYYMIEQAASTYCKPHQAVRYKLYNREGKFVLLVDIKKSDELVYAVDDDGHWQVYFRYNDENIRVPKVIADIWKIKRHRKRVAVYSSNEGMALDFIENNKCVTFDDLVNHIKLSKKTITEIVTNLIIMDLVKFDFDGSRWFIQPCKAI